MNPHLPKLGQRFIPLRSFHSHSDRGLQDHGSSGRCYAEGLDSIQGDLSRRDLKKLITDRNPRLTVIISDSCASFRQETAMVAAPFPLGQLSPLFHSLFFHPSGVVDIMPLAPAKWPLEPPAAEFSRTRCAASLVRIDQIGRRGMTSSCTQTRR